MSSEEKDFDLIILFTEPLIVKDAADEEFIGFFEGIASTPDVDLQGERFAPDVLMANAEKLKGKPILFVHGRSKELGPQPIGKIIEAWFENGVLKIKAGIFKGFEKIWNAIKQGILKALSVGGIAKKIRRENGVIVIEDAEIREVSLTPRGVNPFTRIIKIFNKSFQIDEELGILREITGEEEAESMQEKVDWYSFEFFKSDDVPREFAKVDFDLPIVRREEWDGDAAAARIFKWAEKEDGSIDKAKASKLFLVVRGDGSKRGDYGWPVGDVVDDKPVLVSSGIITAIKYAAGARGVDAPEEVKDALERLAKRLAKEGILPEDYVVPWKRKSADESDELSRLREMIAKTVREIVKEEIEKILNVSKSAEEAPSQPPQLAPPKEPEPPAPPKPEKGLASQDEVVRKAPERRYEIPITLKQLYRELYAVEVSD